MVTHNNKVLDIADRIVALEAGALVESKPQEEEPAPNCLEIIERIRQI